MFKKRKNLAKQVNQSETNLSGTIHRVTFSSEESGYCVLKVQLENAIDVVSVTGTAVQPQVGFSINCEGNWSTHPTWGPQFSADTIHVVPPVSKAGILSYLSSGNLAGVGPGYAKKMFAAFGESVFDVIENEPKKLLNIKNFGEKRLKSVTESWKSSKKVREIMLFLQSQGIGATRATTIYKAYGDKSIDIIRNNPFQLSIDIRGFGFKLCDTLAGKLGVSSESIVRLRAALHHILNEATRLGHCTLPQSQLIQEAAALSNQPEEKILAALEAELENKKLIFRLIDTVKHIYLPSYFNAEQEVANLINSLLSASKPAWTKKLSEKPISSIEHDLKISLSVSQKEAIKAVTNEKVLIITGGPGVGKTTLINSLVSLAKKSGANLLLCAPTGKASRRLAEASNHSASTIHRLLQVERHNGKFFHNKNNPINCDLIIIDEASMIDLLLMQSLLSAIPEHASLILVGDVDQLPSVGAGSVFSDIIQSNTVTTIVLSEIFRQSASSKIITNAHLVNQGEFPDIQRPPPGDMSDFYFQEVSENENILNALVTVVTDRIPTVFGLNPIYDVQVLTPMHKGVLGTLNCNQVLQKILNPTAIETIKHNDIDYSVGDKVIQMINNYDFEIFNGDQGFIAAIDIEDKKIKIQFDDRRIEYELKQLDQIRLAYAITIHKSQGSEYPAVVIPLTLQHYTLLERNLIYTAITRAKTLVVMVGQKKALGTAIKKINAQKRITGLIHCLKNIH